MMTTIKHMLQQGIEALAQQEQRAARLDAQLLLAHVLDVERSALYMYPEREVTPAQAQQFMELVRRRQQGEPIDYIVGQSEFYGVDLLVDTRVLIPRPETELLVEDALTTIHDKIAHGTLPVVADIGTGSGAIPIAIALQEPRLPYLYACDISTDALEVARANRQRHHLSERVRLLQGDLLAPLPEPVDVLTANLPYVGTNEIPDIPPDVLNYEPHLALFSGSQGLHLLQRLCQEALQLNMLKPGAIMLLEIGYQQRTAVTRLLHASFPNATITAKQDYAGWDRVIKLAL